MDLCSGVRICHCPMGAARYAAVVSVVCNSNIAMKMKIQALYLTGTALLIGAAGVGDSITFDAVGSWTGAAILAVLMAAGGIVCWGYGRGLEIERAEKAQLRRYCRKLKSCQRAAEEKNDKHSA